MASSLMLDLSKTSRHLRSLCGGSGSVGMVAAIRTGFVRSPQILATTSTLPSHPLLRASFATVTSAAQQSLTEQDIMQQMLEDVEKITYRNIVEKEHNPFAYHSREDFWTKLKVTIFFFLLLLFFPLD